MPRFIPAGELSELERRAQSAAARLAAPLRRDAERFLAGDPCRRSRPRRAASPHSVSQRDAGWLLVFAAARAGGGGVSAVARRVGREASRLQCRLRALGVAGVARCTRCSRARHGLRTPRAWTRWILDCVASTTRRPRRVCDARHRVLAGAGASRLHRRRGRARKSRCERCFRLISCRNGRTLFEYAARGAGDRGLAPVGRTIRRSSFVRDLASKGASVVDSSECR